MLNYLVKTICQVEGREQIQAESIVFISVFFSQSWGETMQGL